MSSRILCGLLLLSLLLVAGPARANGRSVRGGRAHASRGVVYGGGGYFPYRPPSSDWSEAPPPPATVPDERLLLWLASGNPCYGCHWGTPGASLIVPPGEDDGNVVARGTSASSSVAARVAHTPHQKIIDVAPEPAKEPVARPVRSSQKPSDAPIVFI